MKKFGRIHIFLFSCLLILAQETAVSPLFELQTDPPMPSEGFSPNGDGINDIWYIKNIEQYSTNHVVVYNRWGQVIYEIENYDNNFHAFHGLGNKSYNNQKQYPDGTYYFLIKILGQESIDGYFVMVR